MARTNCWDPFVVWIVDHSQPISSDQTNIFSGADAYIGSPSLVPTIPYPKPPTIAMKNKTNQPLAIRYNQHIVLQCLTTGLVSPVMIVRKVDKASTVVGGARCPSKFDSSISGGGEFGDEILGDPVSQLHKIALQIVQHNNVAQYYDQQANSQLGKSNYDDINMTQQPRSPISLSLDKLYRGDNRSDSMMPQMTTGPVTYLACLNDLVGTHKTTVKRSPIRGRHYSIDPVAAAAKSFTFTASALSASLNTASPLSKKQRITTLEEKTTLHIPNTQQMYSYNWTTLSDPEVMRRRVSSLDDAQNGHRSIFPRSQQNNQRLHSVTNCLAMENGSINTAPINRRNSESTNSGQAMAEFGAYWSEDVTDSAVWTIVGTGN